MSVRFYTVSVSALASTIRECRQASGLTLDQLAREGGVSRSTVAKIEAGNTPDPGFGVVARLLAACRAPEERLLRLYRQVVGVPTARTIGIGYEGLDQPTLIARLLEQSVDVVVDVRLTPLSRKPGLSKKALAQGLADAGIDYVHLPGLGNPKHNRAGYSDPSNTDVRETFSRLLAENRGADHLAQLRTLVSHRAVALLCFESDERRCHREQVLAALPKSCP